MITGEIRTKVTPYANVYIAILFFNKTNSRGTNHVRFYEMQAEGFSLAEKRTPQVEKSALPDIALCAKCRNPRQRFLPSHNPTRMTEQGDPEPMANPEQLKRIKDGVGQWNRWRESNGEAEIDLSGADLRNARLSFVDLSFADLSYADLSFADLSFADLGGVILGNAILSGSDLSGADLSWAILDGANLHGADLSRADLSDADFSDADFSDANLSGANLRRTDLSGANLRMAKLNGAILSGTILDGAIR